MAAYNIITDIKDLDRDVLVKLPSTSAKVRYLTSLNFDRSEISKILNIRYQHVRNIQITPIKKI